MRLPPTTLHQKSKEHPRRIRFSLWRVSLLLGLALLRSLATRDWPLFIRHCSPSTVLFAQQSQNFFVPSRGTWPTLNIGPGNANGGVTNNYGTGAHSGNFYFGSATGLCRYGNNDGIFSGCGLTLSGATVASAFKPSSHSATALQLQTSGGTAVLDVDTNNQRAGIGTASPGASLEVNGVIRGDSASGFSIGSDAGKNRVQTYPSAPHIRFLNTSDQYANLSAGALSPGSSYATTAAPSNGLIVQGNVGIGTTSPNLQLQVGKAMGAGVYPVPVTNNVAYFDASQGNTQKLSQTGNVSVNNTLSGVVSGEVVTFIICPNSHTITGWPPSTPPFKNPMSITTSKCNVQSFVYDGTNMVALGVGLTY